jgi:hypothetical protein
MSEYESRPGANDGGHLPITINTTRDDIEGHLTSLQTRPTRVLRPLDAGAASEMFSEPRAVDEGPPVPRTGTRSDVLFISSCQVAAVFVGGTHGRHASDGTSTFGT